MNDMFGNEINVGDIIVYPGRQGSSLWMNTAVVCKQLPPNTEVHGRMHKGSLKITAIKQDYYFGQRTVDGPRERIPTISSYKTTIHHTDRCAPIEFYALPTDMVLEAVRILAKLRTGD